MFLMFLCQHGRVYVETREKNEQLIHSSTCLLVNLTTRQVANHCNLFSKKINTKSALSVDQPLILPQKIDSREGLF